MNIKEKILFAIEKCEEEVNGQNRYFWIPTIIISLKEMLEVINEGKLNSKERAERIRGLGKIVTDSYDFMQSDIGNAVADAMNEFRR